MVQRPSFLVIADKTDDKHGGDLVVTSFVVDWILFFVEQAKLLFSAFLYGVFLAFAKTMD